MYRADARVAPPVLLAVSANQVEAVDRRSRRLEAPPRAVSAAVSLILVLAWRASVADRP